VAVLKHIEAGDVTLEAAGKILMGGGAAWWTPFGLVHASLPQAAYEETYRLALVWRQPFERNLIAAVQAGVAASVMPGATVETVCNTVLEYAGPLARTLLTRAQRIACDHDGDWDGFVQAVYAQALVEQCSAEVDGPLPAPAVAGDPYRGATILWAEQIPLAFAAFVWGKGDFVKTLAACINLGRDCDSIGSTCGSWIGGLIGLQGMPVVWVDALQNVNIPYMNILKRASDVAGLAGA
jgi:hypothetical protein